jgi:conjugal transfer/entry exclusion protein
MRAFRRAVITLVMSLYIMLLTAQIPVTDVAHIAQTVISIAGGIQRLEALHTQITQFTTRIDQARRHLEKLGVPIPDELRQQTRAFRKFSRAVFRGQSHHNAVIRDYQALYEKENPTQEDMLAWLAKANLANKEAMGLQAESAATLEEGQTLITKLLNLSLDSGGSLQALQSLGHIQSEQTEQIKSGQAQHDIEARRRATIDAYYLNDLRSAHDELARMRGEK